MNRFKQADLAQGASNLSGLAHSLVEWCVESKSEGGDPTRDPAVRLLVYQMSWLCKVGAVSVSYEDYEGLLQDCRLEAEIREGDENV